jgi:hypothetical protein
VRDAAGESDPEARLRAVRMLLADEIRLSMLVGVAVGFELAHTLEDLPQSDDASPQPED